MQKKIESFVTSKFISKIDPLMKGNPLMSQSDSPLLIFLDWDDTLFPTSWLLSNHELSKIFLKASETLSSSSMTFYDMPLWTIEKEYFQTLEEKLFRFMERLVTLSSNMHVAIVTCSNERWIYSILSFFLPKLAIYFSSNLGISITSAREAYESLYPKNSAKWKIESFYDLSNEFTRYHVEVRKKSLTMEAFYDLQILSIGDGMDEKNALKKLKRSPFYKILTKSIQCLVLPSFDELLEEIEYFEKNLHSLIKTRRSFEVCMCRTNEEKTTTEQLQQQSTILCSFTY